MKRLFKIFIISTLISAWAALAYAGFTWNENNIRGFFDYFRTLGESGVTVPMPYTTDLSTLITYLIAAGLMEVAPVIVVYPSLRHVDNTTLSNVDNVGRLNSVDNLQ